ncbi:hypothetical protein MASR2M78_25200 [Treponema sp.]
MLTTVHDGQRSVQIDLYKSAAKTMADASYIGSLVVEDIQPKPKGDPSIELVIGSDGGDELNAEAVDLDSSEGGERQSLSVSLQALDQDSVYEVPDFELEQDEAPPSGLYEKSQIYTEETKRSGFPLILVLALILVLLLIGALLWFFIIRSPSGAAMPEKPATTVVAPVQEVTPSQEVAPPPEPVIEAPAIVEAPVVEAPAIVEAPVEPKVEPKKRVRPPAPVKSYKIPRTIPAEGVRYKIRWGDTLWDISEAFYRNPWLYPRIARFNKIRNPDLIISGTYIRVPPKK